MAISKSLSKGIIIMVGVIGTTNTYVSHVYLPRLHQHITTIINRVQKLIMITLLLKQLAGE
jgi:hypothetical protein